MILLDKNGTLEAPKDYLVRNVYGTGAFLAVEFFHPDPRGERKIIVYLNDQGREVVRTEQLFELPKPIIFQDQEAECSFSWWERFVSFFYKWRTT